MLTKCVLYNSKTKLDNLKILIEHIFRLGYNMQDCFDIDECKEEQPCRGVDQYCHNTRGG